MALNMEQDAGWQFSSLAFVRSLRISFMHAPEHPSNAVGLGLTFAVRLDTQLLCR